MKIELQSVSISSFLNIAEEQTVTFDGPGVYAVIGENRDEGGSNASGKSAFLRALTVLPQGSKYIDITNKEIKNRILGLPSKISGVYKVNGKIVNITRVIGGKLSVSVDGVELDGKTDEIQEKLISVFGISPEHFIHLTHKMQEDFGGFLLMKDSEKKDFLGSFFDTSKIDKAEIQNNTQIKELNLQLSQSSSKLSSLRGSMEVLKSEVDTLTNKVSKYTSTEFISSIAQKKSELTHKEMELQQVESLDVESLLSENEEYTSLTSQLSSSQNMLANTEASLLKEIESITAEINSLQSTINSPVVVPDELVNKVSELERLIKASKAQQDTLNSLLSEKNQISRMSDLATKKALELKPDICHTCGQSITDDIYKKISESIGIEVRQAADLLEANRKRLDSVLANKIDEQAVRNEHLQALEAITLFKVSQDKTNLKQSLFNLQESVRLKKSALAELHRSVKNTEQLVQRFRQTTKDNYNMLLSKLRTEIASLNREVELLERESASAAEALKTANSRYSECLDSVNKIDISIAELSHKINLHNKISEILSRNGFIGYIFDSVLEEINREVNENIKEITVISRLSMYFTPDQVAKSTGTVSKSINYKIFDRNEEVSFSTLSGSEKQSLLIAVDAAVDTVLCRRLGVDINYKILDEQFGWVDSAHKEPLIDFIKNKYSDKIVLIVDHGSELNAAIDKKIVAVKQNGMATISCQAVS